MSYGCRYGGELELELELETTKNVSSNYLLSTNRNYSEQKQVYQPCTLFDYDGRKREGYWDVVSYIEVLFGLFYDRQQFVQDIDTYELIPIFPPNGKIHHQLYAWSWSDRTKTERSRVQTQAKGH